MFSRMVRENQERFLQDHADIFPQIAQTDGADINTADGDGSTGFGQFVQSVQKVHQGRFPGSGAAQDGKGGAGFDGEMDIFENRHQPFVGKIDVVKHDVSMEVGSQPGRIVLLLLFLQNVIDTVDGDTGPCSFRTAPAQDCG